MAASQKFRLCWSNHSSNFVDSLGALLSSENYSDVTLCCQGQIWQLHKLILSAASTHFEHILASIPSTSSTCIILDGPSASDISALVHFIYHGEVNVDQDHLPSLLKTAESLKIKGLTDVSTLTKIDSRMEDGTACHTAVHAKEIDNKINIIPANEDGMVLHNHIGDRFFDKGPMEIPLHLVESKGKTFERRDMLDENSPLNLTCPKMNKKKYYEGSMTDVKMAPNHFDSNLVNKGLEMAKYCYKSSKEELCSPKANQSCNSEVCFQPPFKRIRTVESQNANSSGSSVFTHSATQTQSFIKYGSRNDHQMQFSPMSVPIKCLKKEPFSGDLSDQPELSPYPNTFVKPDPNCLSPLKSLAATQTNENTSQATQRFADPAMSFHTNDSLCIKSSQSASFQVPVVSMSHSAVIPHSGQSHVTASHHVIASPTSNNGRKMRVYSNNENIPDSIHNKHGCPSTPGAEMMLAASVNEVKVEVTEPHSSSSAPLIQAPHSSPTISSQADSKKRNDISEYGETTFTHKKFSTCTIPNTPNIICTKPSSTAVGSSQPTTEAVSTLSTSTMKSVNANTVHVVRGVYSPSIVQNNAFKLVNGSSEASKETQNKPSEILFQTSASNFVKLTPVAVTNYHKIYTNPPINGYKTSDHSDSPTPKQMIENIQITSPNQNLCCSTTTSVGSSVDSFLPISATGASINSSASLTPLTPVSPSTHPIINMSNTVTTSNRNPNSCLTSLNSYSPQSTTTDDISSSLVHPIYRQVECSTVEGVGLEQQLQSLQVVPSSTNNSQVESVPQNAQRVTINMRTFKEEWRKQLLVDYDPRANMSICMLCFTNFRSYDGPRKNTYVKHAKRFHPNLDNYSEKERDVIISMYEKHHKYDIDRQKEINKSFRTSNNGGSLLRRRSDNTSSGTPSINGSMGQPHGGNSGLTSRSDTDSPDEGSDVTGTDVIISSECYALAHAQESITEITKHEEDEECLSPSDGIHLKQASNTVINMSNNNNTTRSRNNNISNAESHISNSDIKSEV